MPPLARQAPAERPEVRVAWIQAPVPPAERRNILATVAGCVTGHRQRLPDAAVLYPAGESRRSAGTTQADEPISYRTAEHRIVGIEWVGTTMRDLRLVTDTGEILTGDRLCAPPVRRTLGDMTNPPSRPRARRPMVINARPGRGGQHRRVSIPGLTTEGLDTVGEIVWWPAPGQARIGVITLDTDGDTVILCRLSTEEKDDRFVGQVEPCMALAERYELRVRQVILAEGMSGTRQVRPTGATGPTPGILERDDIVYLDQLIDEGRVRNIVARAADRLAREQLPAATLLDRWSRAGVALWLSDYGRRMNYSTDAGDRMLMQTMMFISTEERAAIVARMQSARLRKGPLAGNGTLGQTRFGFIRDKGRGLRPDPDQWPWILRVFELADVGPNHDGEGLSTRKIAKMLAEEGCPFDHDRLRNILRDPIYATGEYSARVSGWSIAQTPVPLDNPVPLDRFNRIQELLKLRRGYGSRTLAGAFLLNTVETVHLQCAGQTVRGYPARIRGNVPDDRTTTQRYRHTPGTPSCCTSGGRGGHGRFTWVREQLERPILMELRRLAGDPALLDALQQATRHNIGQSRARLTDAQRISAERELDELAQRRDQLATQWIQEQTTGRLDLADYARLIEAVSHHIRQIETRLARDSTERDIVNASIGSPTVMLDDFLEVMSLDTPTDARHRHARARIFQTLVSRVIIDDSGSGPIIITIEGNLVPEGAPAAAGDPLARSAEYVDAYTAARDGRPTANEARLREIETRLADVQTDLSASGDKSVWTCAPPIAEIMAMPTASAIEALRRSTLDATHWRQRRDQPTAKGVPAWRTTVTIPEQEIARVGPSRSSAPQAEEHDIEAIGARNGTSGGPD